MKVSVLVEPAAENDLLMAFEWYEKQVEGLGYEFLVSIRACFGRLERSPKIYTPVLANLRRARVDRFPFGVFYVIGDGSVFVLAVMHHSKEPEYWRKRFHHWDKR